LRCLLPTAFLLALCAAVACGGDDFTSDDGNGDGDDGDDSGSGAGSSGPPTCSDVCDTRAELGCAGDTRPECESECTYYKTLVRWCDDIAHSLEACLGAEPSESFGCDVPGPLGIRDGVCQAERDALVSCWYEGPPEGLPPEVNGLCETVCGNMGELLCKPPTCVDDCLGTLEPTKSCDGIYAAWLDCAANQPTEAWHCTGESPDPSACGEYAALIAACMIEG